jgi:hypothetical protein
MDVWPEYVLHNCKTDNATLGCFTRTLKLIAIYAEKVEAEG